MHEYAKLVTLAYNSCKCDQWISTVLFVTWFQTNQPIDLDLFSTIPDHNILATLIPIHTAEYPTALSVTQDAHRERYNTGHREEKYCISDLILIRNAVK